MQESGGFVVRFIPYTIRESYSAVSVSFSVGTV